MKDSRNRPMIIGALLAASLLLATCGSTPTRTAVPPVGTLASDTPGATSPIPSATMAPQPSATEAAQPTATDTPMPPATPLPTSPPVPTATEEPVAERISFSPGATSAAVEGNLAVQGMHRYVLAVPSIFLILGRLGKHEPFDRAWTTASVLLMGLLATLFTFNMWAG